MQEQFSNWCRLGGSVHSVCVGFYIQERCDSFSLNRAVVSLNSFHIYALS